MKTNDDFLNQLCREIHKAAKLASEERKREVFGDNPPMELLVMYKYKVRVEIRKEDNSHHEPHMHISHTDKFDISVSLNTFNVLAGKIDRKEMKQLKQILLPKKEQLLEIWNELNENNNCFAAQQIIETIKF